MLVVTSALLLLEDALAVLVELEGGDFAVAGVDGDLGLLTVDLLLNDFINVNASASAVDGDDLAFGTLEGAVHDLDLVTLADGHGANVVLVLEVFGEVAGHHDSADTAGGGEVRLSRLSALAGYT